MTWIEFPGGFVSIVEKDADRGHGMLTVRARDKESLAAYLTMARGKRVDASSIKFDMSTDYPYRARITRKQGDKAALAIMRGIRYSNFKTEAKRVRGGDYAQILGSLWSTLMKLEDKETRAQANKRWAAATVVQPGDDDWPAIIEASDRSQAERDEMSELDDIVATFGVQALTDEQWQRYETLG